MAGYTLKDSYKHFKKKYPEIKVDEKTYKCLCQDFNKIIVRECLNGSIFKLPFNMGSIFCKKFPINWDKPLVNVIETIRQRKRIYHLNKHSEGWNVRWAWSKINKKTTNKIYYSFTATRYNKRALSKVMFEPGGYKKFFA